MSIFDGHHCITKGLIGFGLFVGGIVACPVASVVAVAIILFLLIKSGWHCLVMGFAALCTLAGFNSWEQTKNNQKEVLGRYGPSMLSLTPLVIPYLGTALWYCLEKSGSESENAKRAAVATTSAA